MPINTITSVADLNYAPIKALHGFSFDVTCDWTRDTADPCKIIGDPVVNATVSNKAPLWSIVSGPTSNHWMTEVAKGDCVSSAGHKGKADQVHCQGNVTMALTTPGIPTPWGSIGAITLAQVQVQIDLFVSADGSTRIVKKVDGEVVK